MKLLLVVKQKKNVDTFIGTIRALLARGHAVTLAIQEHGDARDDEYREAIQDPGFAVARCPAQRTDAWAHVAPLLRSLRDCVHYQQPPLRGAAKLQERTIRKLREDLRVAGDHVAVAEALRAVPPAQIQRLESVFELAERQLPSDALHETFLRTHAPDVLLLSPLVHFGSAQADYVASARALGIPVGMLLHSWDNLSTKGCLHQPPDWMFVWNQAQRREAFELHGFPQERTIAVGAPRFDGFFELRPRLTRNAFHEPLSLDPSKPTFLYVCSSQLIAAAEEGFVRKWLAAIRHSATSIADSNVIVRPHPDIPLLGATESIEEIRWPAAKGLKGFISRPFDDRRAIVLRTSDRAQQGFFECLHHSAGVIGLNTSAELEAAIVGRPVYTVEAGDDAEGQRSTLHFHYLLEGHGGIVRVAPTLDEHIGQLASGQADAGAVRAFVASFLRPRGLDRAVSPLLAESIEATFSGGKRTDIERAPTLSAPIADRRNDEETVEDGDERPSGPKAASPTTVVRFPKYGYELLVLTPDDPEAERTARLDKTTVEWMRSHVAIGETVYDIDAGIGLYALLAAKHHGAIVVAFEPGYAVFKELCENVRLNGCDGSITPLPLAIADFEGIGELRYPTGMAGRHKHSLRESGWRVKRPAGDERNVKQPVCTVPLDLVVARFGVPAPHHLRLGNIETSVSVLRGAREIAARESLKTIFLTLPTDECQATATELGAFRWTVAQDIPLSRGRTHLVLSRPLHT